jgi:hypothetical protein
MLNPSIFLRDKVFNKFLMIIVCVFLLAVGNYHTTKDLLAISRIATSETSIAGLINLPDNTVSPYLQGSSCEERQKTR